MRRALLAMVLPAVLLMGLTPADAAVGDLGHDVGWPQCGSALPTGSTFGIVGVTGGLPFSDNPCLQSEGLWASSTGDPMLYVNTANPGHTSSHWPAAGTGRCVDASVDTDAGCAYEYGRAAAADALSFATTALSGKGFSPTGVTWWLDVEGSRTPGQPGNSWVGSGVVNAADLQGFADALRDAGVPEVGIYSTQYQWNDITQGYTRSTSASYRAAWASVARFPLEDGPVWFAGVGTLGEATNRCASTSFTGGERLLSQYADGDYDGDYRCADHDALAPRIAMTAPTSVVTKTASIIAKWSGTDTGGSGVATYDVRYKRAASTGAFGAVQSPASLQRTAAGSWTITNPPRGSTTCVQARSRDAAGNTSAWSAFTCTAIPHDDRALTASSGWTRSTGRGYFASTFTGTTKLGAKLTKSGLVTSRLNLIALRCSTCGKVRVYVGSSLLATVDLRAASTSVAVIALPRFSLRTTTVSIKVISSGKLVRIDGLASSRV